MSSLLVLFAAACGDDEGDVRTEGNGGSASGSGSGSGSASGSGSGSGSASGTEAAECKPVGTDLEADATRTVEMGATEYAFDPSELTVPAGVVTFEVENNGSQNHELAFLPGGGEVPFTADGAPDEDALADAGAFELEAFGPDQTCNATYDLEPGTYTLFCIVEVEGESTTHYEEGMEGTLTVE
jgi:plastocyanin